ncbi:MAG: choice-of-anchor V domain-containing protein, partial [Myxococcota bacterium]
MLARVLAFALCTTPLLSAAHASQTGISGRSGKYTRSCQSCHTGGDFEVAIGLSGPIVLFTNQRGTYTVTITTNGTANAAGFNAAVENQAGASVTNDPDTDPRDDDDGTLFALELGTQLQLGEVTHTAPRDTDESGTAQFRFDWAPNEPGRYTIYAAGNAVDKAGTAQNDQSSLLTDTVQVTVCDDDDVDGVCNDGTDNCPDTPNPDLGSGQPDCDGDGVGDACDASCSAEPSCAGLCFPGTCGDGLVDSSLAEECDDGNTNDDGNGCGPTCLRVNDCGNSIVEPAFETCDDGSGNSDTQPDACRSDCQQAYCGDGVIDTGEACDDGNTIDDGNGCSADCNINSVCGDGVVQDVTENCDDGNTIDDGDGCSAECIFNNVCGDGQLESAAEECDDGNAADDGNGCSENCENNAVCGDGITATLFETCDDGNTVDDGNGCDDRCLRNDFCGNGLRERLFEACDDGDANSNTTPNACRTDCSRNRCGDGVVDVDEECDSGNANSDTLIDACRADCTTSRCGDGVVDTGEFCDEGTLNSPIDGDRCRMTCVLPACGDGVVDAIAGEAC